MGNFEWQLIAVLICVAVATWSLIGRLKRLLEGKGGCGDCSKAQPAANDADDAKLVPEDQIQILYETKK
jgi:hypothetical protein